MIEIDAHDKIRIAKSGANKLFEIDYETRQGMSKQQLIELFDRIWLDGLRHMVIEAEVIEPEEVSRRL